MRAEFVNPFVLGASDVTSSLLSLKPTLGKVTARPRIFTTQEVNVVCGITGLLHGQVIYGMSAQTAASIVETMLGGVEADEELRMSCLSELGNMISGNSMTHLSAAGYPCDITPPSIIRGIDVSISTVNIPALVIPLVLGELGALEVNVSLKQKTLAEAA